MSKSTRRPQRIYAIVMWVLSLVFAGFLIGLGGLVISDMRRVDAPLTLEGFMADGAVEALDARQDALQKRLVPLRRISEDQTEALNSARADYSAAKVDFDAWIATRTATENVATNPEVLRRTRDVEGLVARVRAAQRAVEAAQTDLRTREREMMDLRKERSELREAARPDYRSAVRARDLRVFGFRLALTLPLLLIAAWMVAKKRGSPWWPLLRGFVLFALFAFFVELVPYLPSYGGYVRYSVGVIGVGIAGYFLIRGMRKYLARKQAEEARSEAERRQSIDYETALKKIAAKSCPGCDRAIVTRDGVHSDYCVHCGIHLQRKCPNCNTRNVTFYRFCLACGTENDELVKPGPDPNVGPT